MQDLVTPFQKACKSTYNKHKKA